MAEVTGLRNNALPYEVYGCPYGVIFPIFDNDGDLVTGAAGLDSEVSKNGDTFADCTNEATEIATNSGMYYLLLTGTEMTADAVAVIVKTSTTDAKTTPLVFRPRKLVSLATGTSQGGAAGYITLAAGTVLFDNQFSGCLCVATIDGNVEARILGACTQSNQQCAVTPGWNVTPDSDDTYIIYLPEGMRFPTANVKAISDDSAAADNLESACDNYSATRGLAGTALPAAAADAAGGLPISDAGGLDLDALKADTTAILLDTGTDGVVLPQAQADKVWGTAARALTDKAGFTISGTKTTLDALSGTDADTLKTLSDQLDVAQADLDSPDQYKATGFATPTNVSDAQTAITTVLDAIKGVGWATQTLVAISALVDDLETRLTTARAGYLDNLSAGAVALEANVQTHAAAALTAYDPPTRAEATADKAEIEALVEKIRKVTSNRLVVTPSTGEFTIYADDGVTPLVTGTISSTGRSAPTWL